MEYLIIYLVCCSLLLVYFCLCERFIFKLDTTVGKFTFFIFCAFVPIVNVFALIACTVAALYKVGFVNKKLF